MSVQLLELQHYIMGLEHYSLSPLFAYTYGQKAANRQNSWSLDSIVTGIEFAAKFRRILIESKYVNAHPAPDL